MVLYLRSDPPPAMARSFTGTLELLVGAYELLTNFGGPLGSDLGIDFY